MKIDGILDELANAKHELYPKAVHNDIEKTEKLIGASLPESYRQFVSQFSNGAYLFMIQEVSAVGDGNKQINSIQNLCYQFWAANKDIKLDKSVEFQTGRIIKRNQLIPFSLDHNGNQWCFINLNLELENEYPVAYLNRSNSKLYGQLESFASWLKILLDSHEEVIRSLYSDNIIFNELGLG